MRELVRFEAECREAVGLRGRLFMLVANWRARNDLRRLQAMDDFALRDIGLSREDICKLQRLPLAIDIRTEAERLRRGNGKG